jgi:hypothetical protein
MKLIRVQEAAGQTLCHDVTQIVKGGATLGTASSDIESFDAASGDVTKNVLFKKGHIICKEDIPTLLNLGEDHIYIWEDDGNMLHENDAAEILRSLCQGENMHATGPHEGKIELIADTDGLLMVDTGRLRAVNSLGEMMIATRVSGYPVHKGDKLCGMRIIPLSIKKETMENARRAAGASPLLTLLPIKPKKYGLVITGNEIFYKRIEDGFTPVIQKKMEGYNCEMIAHEIMGDDHEKITASIKKMLDKGAEIVLCTGGMSVDPDDTTPLAIKNAALSVVNYGTPVLPGAMFMLAYTADKKPVCGLPGCVMYSGRTVFDLVLPRLLADVPVTAEWLAGLGNGGLCLNCTECHFPNCSFGKGP